MTQQIGWSPLKRKIIIPSERKQKHMNIPSTRNDIYYNQKCKQTTGFTNMEKCYYFLYQKHNLIILLKVNDFTKAWFLQGREWYSGKWMIISNCEHSFVYLVKWHFLNKQSTSTINSVGDILLRWRHSNEHLNFLTLSIFLANKNFQSNVTF